jgi:hypothetical protein
MVIQSPNVQTKKLVLLDRVHIGELPFLIAILNFCFIFMYYMMLALIIMDFSTP